MTKILSDEVFESMHHSVNMLHSLQNSHDTVALDRGEIDEKLFDELNKFESFLKDFESMFLQIVSDDVQAISNAAVINPGNFERAEELISGIDSLIAGFNRMESEYISKSESLKSRASHFKARLAMIKDDMGARVRHNQKYSMSLNTAIIGPKMGN